MQTEEDYFLSLSFSLNRSTNWWRMKKSIWQFTDIAANPMITEENFSGFSQRHFGIIKSVCISLDVVYNSIVAWTNYVSEGRRWISNSFDLQQKLSDSSQLFRLLPCYPHLSSFFVWFGISFSTNSGGETRRSPFLQFVLPFCNVSVLCLSSVNEFLVIGFNK